MCTNRGPRPVNGDWGGMVGIWGLRPGWAGGFGFGVGADWGSGSVSADWGPGSVDAGLGPGLMDPGLMSGLVNADWGPVNADLGPRPGFTSPSDLISFGNL